MLNILQRIVTREVTRDETKKTQTYISKPRMNAQIKKSQLDDKIVSIVQCTKGKNTKQYSRTSCLVVIPKSVCKLGGIHEGSLVTWELSKYEHNVFTIRVLSESEGVNA